MPKLRASVWSFFSVKAIQIDRTWTWYGKIYLFSENREIKANDNIIHERAIH